MLSLLDFAFGAMRLGDFFPYKYFLYRPPHMPLGGL